MAFSDQLLDAGADIWEAQKSHPFVNELADGTLDEISAALFPCGQGYLDIGAYAAERAQEEHRYTPWIDTYTSEQFREAVGMLRNFVDRCGERYPGEHDAMREAFLTSARLEYAFWEMAYTGEQWDV